MTAEIAVLNKSAVALATDSAGTIGGGSETKIYNTVNKIFELSRKHPVGVMIYGSLDFMGLPLETLIKKYREQLEDRSFATINEYVADFESYLTKVPHVEQDELIQIFRMLARPFRDLNTSIDRAVIENAVRSGGFKRSKVNGVVLRETRRMIARYKSTRLPRGFYGAKRPVDLLNRLAPVFDQAIKTHIELPVITAQARALLVKLAEEVVLRTPLSSHRTGIVIAGFGDNELCPSLKSIEVDGIIGGKLKVLDHKQVDIGRYTVGADVLGFAQDDMVERFLNGVDPAYNRFMSRAVKKLLDNIVSDLQKNNPNATPQIAAALTSVFDKIRDDLDKELSQYRDKTFKKPTIDLVRFMPKPELAKLAESMIELTSLKRRVSWDQDTVGGDVDVAVISKAEGFVWIKRKHYFPSELNPRFFHRLSTSKQGGAA